MASPASPTEAHKEDHVPSTSKIDLELEIVETLGKMMIGCKSYTSTDDEKKKAKDEDEVENKPGTSVDAPTEQSKDEKRRSSWTFRSGRYTPYLLPKKPKMRSRSMSMSVLDYNELAKVRWKGDKDMDYLKLGILDEKKSIPCGVEAARPPTPDCEVDELAEYFSHFVRVEMKMSALAESMYC